jgi:hypothetical protein
MIQCPACGQDFDEDDVAELDVNDPVECWRCEGAWIVASLEPLRLEAAERELAFTD